MYYYKKFNYATRLRSRNYIRRRAARKANRKTPVDNTTTYVDLVPRNKRTWYDTHVQGFHFPPIEYNVEQAESKEIDWAESYLRKHPKLANAVVKSLDKIDEFVVGPTADKLMYVSNLNYERKQRKIKKEKEIL